MHDTLISILKEFEQSEGTLISLLQETQNSFGYVPREAVYWYSNELDIPASRLFGIITFYSQFRPGPRGRNIITACCGTACHVRGSERLIDAARKELALSDDKDTTDDGEFTVEKLACLGACSLAPVVMINGKAFGKATVESLTGKIRTLKNMKKNE